LKQIRDQRAKELGLAPGLVCPNACLKALASMWPAELDRKMKHVLKGWQREILEEDLERVLA
jgi:hypothetical protein